MTKDEYLVDTSCLLSPLEVKDVNPEGEGEALPPVYSLLCAWESSPASHLWEAQFVRFSGQNGGQSRLK